MTGERRLNGNLRGLKVSCLAYHNTIRVLAQERPQGSRKGQTDTFVHRQLHDATKSYSTGSSAVISFESIVLILRKQE